MRNDLLDKICRNLNSKGVKDAQQSIIGKRPELSVDSGFIKMLSWLPTENLMKVCGECSIIAQNAKIADVYKTFSKLGFLYFKPYVYTDAKFGKVLVCGINRFIVYVDGHIKVITDLNSTGALSTSKGDLRHLLNVMYGTISVDCYNAIVATVISTAYMCNNLRDCVRQGESCITEFLAYIIQNCRAYPIYSVETFKSKLSWMDRTDCRNINIEIAREDQTYYLVSIGADASTVYYNTDLDTVGFVSMLYNSSMLRKYDSQFGRASVYFAHALCLLVVDIFHRPFPCTINTGILYKQIPDISKLYEV